MSEHARLSPSGSGRWMRCAASIGMSEGKPDKSSGAAEEGTRAHIALEAALKMWIATGDEFVDINLCDDQDMYEHVLACLHYVIERYELMPCDQQGGKLILIEQRVDLHYMTMRDDLWGKADVIIVSDQHIDVLDLKYGAGIFVGADTSQNRIYLLGAMAKFMKDSRGAIPWKSVRSTIMQPRYPDKDGNTIRFIDHDPNELLLWNKNVLLPAAIATDDPNAIPVAGDQCGFCLAKSGCPAVEKKVEELCSVFQPVPGVTVDEDVDGLQIERLMEVHDNIPFIQGYLTAVSKKIRDLLEARDTRLQGKLKLVRSRQMNKWSLSDDEIAIELTKGKGRLLKDELFKQVVITAPQALKLKGLKPAQKKRLQDYVVKSEGSLSIVPDSDPRTNCFPAMPFEEVAPEQPETTHDFL